MKNEDQNCPSFCSPTVSIRIDLLIDNRLMCAAVVLIPAIWYCGWGFMKALALLVRDEKQWGTDWIQWIDQRILDRRASSLPPREHHHHRMFGSSKKMFWTLFLRTTWTAQSIEYKRFWVVQNQTPNHLTQLRKVIKRMGIFHLVQNLGSAIVA